MPPSSTRAAIKGTPDRFGDLDREAFDVVVVGSGSGGLTAAALLARAGRSVLVLERHTVAGGHATVFHRPGYEFDVGLHYIGGCGPGGAVPRLLRAAGVEDVEFREMDPDGFDTLCFPDFVFRVPRGMDAFRARLLERFPAEAQGIERYLEVLSGVFTLQNPGSRPADILRSLWRARLALWHRNSTLARFLDSCTADPRLKAVLAAQNGLYAEPPSRASLAIHAVIVRGYLEGAYYPAGGGQVISDRLAESVERHGGRILLGAAATRILIEGARVTGVEFESAKLGRRRVRAPLVVSDADLKHTLLQLVGRDKLRARTVERVQGYEMAPSLGVVFLGINRNLWADRTANSNFWIHPSYDQEAVYAEARAGRFHPEPSCFLSSTSLKDPENRRAAPRGFTNLELMAVVPSQPEAWGTTAAETAQGTYRQNRAYRQAKEAFAQRLIAVAERVFPGLGQGVDFLEVASPLSLTRFTGASGGTAYGIGATPGQSLFRRPGNVTEIGGLYLCGASTLSGHGIVGTMWSGAMVASRIAGRAVLEPGFGES